MYSTQVYIATTQSKNKKFLSDCNRVYTQKLKLTEHHIYGSSRVGVRYADTTLVVRDIAISGYDSLGFYVVSSILDTTMLSVDTANSYRTLAKKQYELSDHLGNVLANVMDRHTPIGASTISKYNADIAYGQYYYPFGMTMSKFNGDTTYLGRFAFNGKERDDKDGVVEYDYGARIYDSRLGRFKSVDPLFKGFPWWTPYQFAGNKPISSIDIDGLEEQPVNPNTTPSDPNLVTLNNLNEKIDGQLNEMWRKSNSVGPNGRVAEEWGGAIFSSTTTYRSMSTGQETVVTDIVIANQSTDHDPGSVDINHRIPTNLPSPVLLGEAHTHPYAEGSMYEGFAFSSYDIAGLTPHSDQKGYVSIVEAGDKRFALVITDPKKATEFLKNNSKDQLKKQIFEVRKSLKTTDLQEAQKVAVQTVLKDSGISFYETTDTSKKKFEKVSSDTQEAPK